MDSPTSVTGGRTRLREVPNPLTVDDTTVTVENPLPPNERRRSTQPQLSVPTRRPSQMVPISNSKSTLKRGVILSFAAVALVAAAVFTTLHFSSSSSSSSPDTSAPTAADLSATASLLSALQSPSSTDPSPSALSASAEALTPSLTSGNALSVTPTTVSRSAPNAITVVGTSTFTTAAGVNTTHPSITTIRFDQGQQYTTTTLLPSPDTTLPMVSNLDAHLLASIHAETLAVSITNAANEVSPVDPTITLPTSGITIHGSVNTTKYMPFSTMFTALTPEGLTTPSKLLATASGDALLSIPAIHTPNLHMIPGNITVKSLPGGGVSISGTADVTIHGNTYAATVQGSLTNTTMTLTAYNPLPTPWALGPLNLSDAHIHFTASYSSAHDVENHEYLGTSLLPLAVNASLQAKLVLNPSGTTVDLNVQLPVHTPLNDHICFGDARLSQEVRVMNLCLTVDNSSVAATANLTIDTGLASAPMSVAVTGSLAHDELSLTGTLDNFPIHVGHTGTAITNIVVTFASSPTSVHGSLVGSLALGDDTFHASALLPRSPTEGFALTLSYASSSSSSLSSATTGSALSALVGSFHLSTAPIPSDTLSSVTSAPLTTVATITITSRPTLVSFSFYSLELVPSSSVAVTLVAHPEPASTTTTNDWSFSFGASLATPFTLPHVTSAAAPDFNSLSFTSGALAFSSSAASPYSYSLRQPKTGAILSQVTAAGGVAIKALIPLAPLLSHLSAEAAASTPSSALSTVDIAFTKAAESSPSLISASLSIPSLALDTHHSISLSNTKLSFVAHGAPVHSCDVSLDSLLHATYGGSNLTATVTGSVDGSCGAAAANSTTSPAYSLSGSVTDWVIDPLITVASASVSVSKTPTSNTTGSVTGTLDIGSATFAASLDLPARDVDASLRIPLIRVSPHINLDNVTLTAADDATATSDIGIAAEAVFGLTSAHPLRIDVSGTLKPGDDLTISGSTANSFVVDHAFTLDELSLSLGGPLAPSHSSLPAAATSLHGSLSGRATLLDVPTSIAASAALPLHEDGYLRVSLEDIPISSSITLSYANVTVRPEYLDLAASLSVATSGPNDPALATVTVQGLVYNSSDYTLAGHLAHWDPALGWELTNVDLMLRHIAGKPTMVLVEGDLTIAGTVVQAEVVLPSEDVTFTLPYLRLSPHVVLRNVSLEEVDAGALFALSATAAVSVANDHELTFAVTGVVSHGSVSIAGSYANADDATWTLNTGVEPVELRSLTINATWTSPDTFSGFIRGEATWAGEDSFTAELDLSNSALTEVILKYHDASRVTFASVVAATSSSALPAAPSDTVGLISSPRLTDVVVVLDLTHSDVAVKASATIAIPSITSLVHVAFVSRELTSPSKHFAWSFALSITAPVAFSQLVPSQTGFDHLPFAEGALVFVSDVQMTPVALPIPGSYGGTASSDVVTLAGMTFIAWLPMATLSAHLDVLGRWHGVEGVSVAGHLGNPWELTATLPANLPIGSDVTVNGTVTLKQTDPMFVVSASMAVKISSNPGLPPVRAHGSVSIDGNGDFALSGTADVYHMHIGHYGIDCAEVNVSLVEKSAGEVEGVFGAQVTLASAKFALEIKIPTPSDEDGFEFDLIWDKAANINILPDGSSEEASVTLTNLVNGLVGSGSGIDSISIPSDFSHVFSSPAQDLTLTVQTQPLLLKANAQMFLFHMEDSLAVELVVGQDDGEHGVGAGNWGFGAAVSLDVRFDLSSVLPSFGSVIDKFAFASGLIVFSNFEDPEMFSLNGERITVTDSVSLVLELEMNQGLLGTVSDWAHLASITVVASYRFDDKAFRLADVLDVDWKIGSAVTVTNTSMFLDIGPPRGLDVGVGVELAIQVGKRSEDTLGFQGEIMFAEEGLIFDAKTLNPWVAPFGMHSVTIGDVEIEIGISEAGVPDLVGISGSLTIGDVTGSATVYVDATKPEDTVIAGSLTKWNLANMLEHIVGHIPSALSSTVLDVGFTDLELSINTGEKPLHFNQQIFYPGFLFKVGSFVLFDVIKGYAEVALIEDHGLFVNASVDPIHIGPGGEIFSLSGFSSPSEPARLLIDLGYQSSVSTATSAAAGVATGLASMHQNQIFASVRAHVLEILELDAYVSISDKGWDINMTYVDAGLTLEFQCSAHLGVGFPSDFNLYASIDEDFLGYLKTHVTSFLEQARGGIDSGIDSAEAKVRDWQEHREPTLNANKAKIAEYKAADERTIDSANSKLNSAKGGLSRAESRVNGLQNEINEKEHDKEHCHHFDPHCWAHNAKEDTEIAGLWTAKHAADAALSVAKGAVSIAEDAVRAAEKPIADGDPRVLALETADGAIEAAGDAAEAALHAAEAVSNAAIDFVEWPLDKLAEAFGAQHAFISATSLSNVKHGEKITLGLSGSLVGHSYSWSLEINFPPKIDDIVSSVWAKIKEDLHLK